MKKEDSFIRTKNWGNDGDVTYLSFLDNGIKRRMTSTESIAEWQINLREYVSLEEIYQDFSNPFLVIENIKAYNSELEDVYGYSKIFPLCTSKNFDSDGNIEAVMITFIGVSMSDNVTLVNEIITKPSNSFEVHTRTKSLL